MRGRDSVYEPATVVRTVLQFGFHSISINERRRFQ
nr:MAG TPA: hypothetical protein [Caudoviricetes sp.]